MSKNIQNMHLGNVTARRADYSINDKKIIKYRIQTFWNLKIYF